MRGLAGAIVAAGCGRRCRSRRRRPAAVGPYPDLGTCSVFPAPPPGTCPPTPPLSPTRPPGTRTSPRRPVARQLRRDDRLHRRPRRQPPPPRLRLAARLRLPLRGRRRRPAQAADPLHRLRRRERSRAVPGPERRPGRGRQGQRRRPPRARRRPLQLHAVSSSTAPSSSARRRRPLERRLRRPLGPALDRRPSRLLDLGRRRRAADLPWPGPLRRSRRRPARTRDPGHLRQHPQRLGPPRLALRRRHLRPERAVDGDATAAQGRLRPRRLQRRRQA